MTRTPLASFLADRQPETLLTVPPAGNHGDALLQSGFRAMATDLGVPIRRLGTVLGTDLTGLIDDVNPRNASLSHPTSLVRAAIAAGLWALNGARTDVDTVYIHGGGNFNELWGDGVGCFEVATRFFEGDIVVGPQSCQFERTDPRSLFVDVSNEVHLFCRERYSYELMDEAVSDLPHVTAHLSPDTALYYEREDLVRGSGTEEYTLLAFRGDRESAGSRDVDCGGDTATVEEDISVTRDSLSAFVEAVARAERVHTDRLHVGVLATILGKPTTLYANAYHKNRGVYEYSLSGYEHVEFVE